MQLHRARREIEETGAKLVVIGNGAPSFIEGFRERSGFRGPIYTDPELGAYRALRLRRDLGATLSLRTLSRSVQAFRDGNRQVGTQGDPLQQGGVFVVDRSGAPVYEHRSQFAGDHPRLEELLEAARRAASDPA